MQGSNNTQTTATGGNLQTGNPQNIGGGQSLAAPQNNLQTQGSADLLKNTNLRITDQNGKALGVSTTTKTTVQTASQPDSNHNSQLIIGASIVVILAVLAASWWMGRNPARSGY